MQGGGLYASDVDWMEIGYKSESEVEVYCKKGERFKQTK